MKNLPAISAIAILVVLLFSTAYADESSIVGKYKAEVETLHGISVFPDSISIDVISTGCTTVDDFKWIIKRERSKEQTLVTIIRTQPDPCDAVAHNVTLTFIRKEIGLRNLETFRVVNAFREFPYI